MNNKTITPSFPQPVDRIASGQLPSALAELSEAALSSGGALSSGTLNGVDMCRCSHGGDED